MPKLYPIRRTYVARLIESRLFVEPMGNSSRGQRRSGLGSAQQRKFVAEHTANLITRCILLYVYASLSCVTSTFSRLHFATRALTIHRLLSSQGPMNNQLKQATDITFTIQSAPNRLPRIGVHATYVQGFLEEWGGPGSCKDPPEVDEAKKVKILRSTAQHSLTTVGPRKSRTNSSKSRTRTSKFLNRGMLTRRTNSA